MLPDLPTGAIFVNTEHFGVFEKLISVGVSA
jgi:hypothetical protein